MIKKMTINLDRWRPRIHAGNQFQPAIMEASCLYPPGDPMAKTGSFVLMLHSHLPWYRQAGMWPFGEENLYECMLETYLPLATMLEDLVAEGISPGITLGLTPILVEQLADPYLQEGFVTYIKDLQRRAEEDVERFNTTEATAPNAKHLAYLAQYYLSHFRNILDEFENRYQRDVVGAFKRLQDAGHIEITTSGATHGFSPLLGTPEAVESQFRVGVESYNRHFGRDPKGVWLPECAYRPAATREDLSGKPVNYEAIETVLHRMGLHFFFTEYSAIEGSTPADSRKRAGIYESIEDIPNELPSAGDGLTTLQAYELKERPVAVMARNHRASFQVWSAEHGYPGDGLYREFHKKDTVSGLHYWCITSKQSGIGDKQLYDPVRAFAQTEGHASHFVSLIEDLVKEAPGEHALICVSFDTELYGHWWYEGVAWLGHVLRWMHGSKAVQPQTSSSYLAEHPPKTAINLPESTWGAGGHYWVWQNEQVNWMWPEQYAAEERFLEAARRFDGSRGGKTPSELERRVLNQAYRELLLGEASDWPFLVTTGQASEYAAERFQEHFDNCNALLGMLEDGAVIDPELLEELEAKNNAFPAIDYRWYRLSSGTRRRNNGKQASASPALA